MAVVSFTNSELSAEITSFIDENKEIWFKARDLNVAIALGYTNPREAIRDHVRDKYRTACGSLQQNNKRSESLPLASTDGFHTRTWFVPTNFLLKISIRIRVSGLGF